MNSPKCPKCRSFALIKSGVIKNKQRYKCKGCGYFFTVDKLGKQIDNYYVTKALQLYIEGLSYREIERLLGISHVSVMNWVKQYRLSRPENSQYHPTYKILTHTELIAHIADKKNLAGAGSVITELGDKFMLIKWERFRN
ncbi:MAG: helix-turn-helix domain-containing protein [Chitinophagales bacterium]